MGEPSTRGGTGGKLSQESWTVEWFAETTHEQQGHEMLRESESQGTDWKSLLARLEEEAASGKVLLDIDKLDGVPGGDRSSKWSKGL